MPYLADLVVFVAGIVGAVNLVCAVDLVVPVGIVPFTERLLGMVESTGGATREQLIDNLGVSPGGEGEAVTAALAEASVAVPYSD